MASALRVGDVSQHLASFINEFFLVSAFFYFRVGPKFLIL